MCETQQERAPRGSSRRSSPRRVLPVAEARAPWRHNGNVSLLAPHLVHDEEASLLLTVWRIREPGASSSPGAYGSGRRRKGHCDVRRSPSETVVDVGGVAHRPPATGSSDDPPSSTRSTATREPREREVVCDDDGRAAGGKSAERLEHVIGRSMSRPVVGSSRSRIGALRKNLGRSRSAGARHLKPAALRPTGCRSRRAAPR